jgi:two-component system cell cycle response regulator
MSNKVSEPTSVISPERMGHLQALRAVFVCLVIVSGKFAARAIGVGLSDLAVPCGAYVGVIFITEVLRRRRGSLKGWLVMGTLGIDVAFLAWVTYLSGGIQGPLRFLVYTHLIAVILLTSYRTGVKVALAHLVLLVLVFNAQLTGWLPARGVLAQVVQTGSLSVYQPLLMSALALALITLGTAPFSSLNERELRRRKGDLEVLAALTEELENAKGATRVSRTLLERTCETFGFERGAVLAGADGRLSLMAGRETRKMPDQAVAVDEVVTRAWKARDALLVDRFDLSRDPSLAGLLPAAKNLLLVPLVADAQPLGVLTVEQPKHRGDVIERRTISMVSQFASHGALAIRNAWLLEQVQKMAETDALTGVANRRAFETALEREIARSMRYGEELTLIMLDIDHFKNLNDTYGHQAGDEVLRKVGAAIRLYSRESDTAARYGGEEFAILLPSCTRRQSFTAASRLRELISQIDAVAPITVSAGIATYPAHAHTAEGLVRAADDALYESKRAGRDRATRSTRGAYFRSNERRRALGKPPVRPLGAGGR